MARLPRPRVPLAIQAEVAERQVREASDGLKSSESRAAVSATLAVLPKTAGKRLRLLLGLLFGSELSEAELDHDPPLATRRKVRNRAEEIVGYDPPANDPNHLFWRIDHRTKTYVRGDHGQHPDRVLIKQAKRIEAAERGKHPHCRSRPIANRGPKQPRGPGPKERALRRLKERNRR